MKFVHFTAFDGKTVAFSVEGVVIRPPLEGADPPGTVSVISVGGVELKVRETMASIEERLSLVGDPK